MFLDQTKYDQYPKQLDCKQLQFINTYVKNKAEAYQIGPLIKDKLRILAVPLCSCTNDPESIIEGISNRIMRDNDEPDRKKLINFEKFCRSEISKLYKRQSKTTVKPFRDWIKTRKYPESKKRKYQIAYEERHGETILRWNAEVNAFVKKEFYPTPKPARMIHARDLVMSSLWGPYVTRIEKNVFHDLWYQEVSPFLKIVPARERPTIIEQTFSRYPHDMCLTTDYSKFENSFCSEIIDSVENHLYRKYFPNDPVVRDACRHLRSKQRIRYKGFQYTVPARRMSGDMNTSLGNSFTNLMLVRYFMHRLSITDFRTFVEGDDCIVKPPTPLTERQQLLICKWSGDLGFNLTLENFGPANEAGFCSTYWDDQSKDRFIEPTQPLLKLGWSFHCGEHNSTQFRQELLKAKCLSYLANTPNAPIISPICYKILTQLPQSTKARQFYNAHDYEELVRKGLDVTICGTWMYINLKNIDVPCIQNSTRITVSRLFGIHRDDQIRIENDSNLESLSGLLAQHLPIESHWGRDFLLA
jgi:hypothetical protein